ncbi:MAG: lactate utilization protein [Anaerocolumna sp.]|jgi:hypothetical protein|nr:lactate utilization protein [Anaerocolumna sp.]
MRKEKFALVEKKLRDRGYIVNFFDTAIQASEYIDSQVDSQTIGFGGSMTLEQIGLYEILNKHNTVISIILYFGISVFFSYARPAGNPQTNLITVVGPNSPRSNSTFDYIINQLSSKIASIVSYNCFGFSIIII